MWDKSLFVRCEVAERISIDQLHEMLWNHELVLREVAKRIPHRFLSYMIMVTKDQEIIGTLKDRITYGDMK